MVRRECFYQTLSSYSIPLAGVGVLIAAGERYGIPSETGAVLMTIGADRLDADEYGICHPECATGQQWPMFESN